MSSKAISSSDPNALEKLNTKLEACEKRQAYMKEVNAYYRKFGTCQAAPLYRTRWPRKLTRKSKARLIRGISSRLQAMS
ncbi:hypothetical protein P378_09040 [Desulforamulus profundi]|uniref:Uncharacterized protein n=1 Tax=Desulforamulus profundi TaxID=1383067 RepID=A0A2C6MGR1_9FIRM|nr:hypothetical protein [Desulforamulus profundi]PHJ38653.1 hypothetical protein P378_09040 [Desulforamulus profundi]